MLLKQLDIQTEETTARNLGNHAVGIESLGRTQKQKPQKENTINLNQWKLKFLS